MSAQLVAVSSIKVENRKRPVDSATVAELKKSIEQQGLLQNIGVQESANGYRLVFGAHRLEAIKSLGWPEVSALVFPETASEDECLLAELQENNARKELTGAERKAFAAEVGRLITKLQENSHDSGILNENKAANENWLSEMGKSSGTPTQTLYRWWGDFCKSSALDIPPKQAGADEKAQFFAWLDEQKAKEEAAKAAKAAEAEAERKRRAEDAKRVRMEKDMEDMIEYLDATAKEWGADIVRQWVKSWLALPA